MLGVVVDMRGVCRRRRVLVIARAVSGSGVAAVG